MSKFRSVVLVGLQAVIERLPARSVVLEASLKGVDERGLPIPGEQPRVEVIWDCDQLVTPWTVPVDWTPGIGQAMPDQVRDLSRQAGAKVPPGMVVSAIGAAAKKRR